MAREWSWRLHETRRWEGKLSIANRSVLAPIRRASHLARNGDEPYACWRGTVGRKGRAKRGSARQSCGHGCGPEGRSEGDAPGEHHHPSLPRCTGTRRLALREPLLCR